jgi:hypothetical protein
MKKNSIEKRMTTAMVLACILFSAGAALGAGPKVSLTVDDKTERNEETDEKIRENRTYGYDVTTTTDTETEICVLKGKVMMRGVARCDCQLEWAFLSEKSKDSKNKAEVVIFSPGKKEITLQENVAMEMPVLSATFVHEVISYDFPSSNNSSSSSYDKTTGGVYKGYIVLVTFNGEILDKASNSSRYLKDEWIEKVRDSLDSSGENKRNRARK